MSASAFRSLVVVSAGLSQPSSTRLLADRLSAAVDRHLRAAGIEPQIQVIELRDQARDLVNNLLAGFPSPGLQAALEAVLAADGLIAVTPIFSASYSGLFKLFFDLVERDGLAGKPVLIAATGGTARHSLALEHAMRPLFAYLNAAVIATAVYAATEDWGRGRAAAAAEDGLVERIDRAALELSVAMSMRGPAAPKDPLADPSPFDQLLQSS